MKAELLPLKGKHYGSVIEVEHEGHSTTIEVWCNADFIPSDRELEDCHCSLEEWYEEYAADGHFESQWQLDLCRKIVKALNA